MFNSNFLDVAIGIVFVFLLLSLICSAAHELIEVVLKQRAANLERGITELAGANSADFVAKLYRHGLINSLYAGTYEAEAKGFFKRLFNRYFKRQDLPSYIPAQNFALALIDLRKTAPDLLPQNVKDALQSFERVAGQDVAQLQQHIEDWFNSSMDRVSGWYKRSSQRMVMFLGLVLTIAVNADCIAIAKRLSTNSALRNTVAQLADSTIKETPAPSGDQSAAGGTQTANASNQAAAGGNQNASQANAGQDAAGIVSRIQQHLKTLDAIGLPLSRDYSLRNPGQLWTATKVHWLGWLLTALAVSLGAPFWFDMLNKIMVVRSTVKPSEKSGPEGSKDAQTPRVPVIAPTSEVAVIAPPPPDGGQSPVADSAGGN